MIFEPDFNILKGVAHQKFFSRKFSSDANDRTRTEVTKFISNNTYDMEFSQHFPQGLVE